MYAVIKIGGKQYRVAEGDILAVDKLPNQVGEQIDFPEVLLMIDNNHVQIGQPTVSQATVKAKILEQLKGEKIRIARFKAKVRYRRLKGFRPLLTKIQIEKIATQKAQKIAEKALKKDE